MGAISIYREGNGMSMKEALTSLQEKARYEYGTDYYNGQINNASLSRDVTHLFELCTTKKKKEQFIREWSQKANKGEVYGVCIVQPKQSTRGSTKVNKRVQKGARKWVTAYEIENIFGETVVTKYNQTDAIKKAKELTEKTQKKHYVFITKVLDKGSLIVATVEPKSSSKKLGKYIFFGCVPD